MWFTLSLSLWERRTKALTRPSAGLSQRERRTKALTLWERVGMRVFLLSTLPPNAHL